MAAAVAVAATCLPCLAWLYCFCINTSDVLSPSGLASCSRLDGIASSLRIPAAGLYKKCWGKRGGGGGEILQRNCSKTAEREGGGGGGVYNVDVLTSVGG